MLAKLIAISTMIAARSGAPGSDIPIGPLTIPIVASCPPTAIQRSWISSVMLRRPAGARAGVAGRIDGLVINRGYATAARQKRG